MTGRTADFSVNHVENELKKLKNILINSLIIAVAVIGLPALIISIISSVKIGHFPVISTIAYGMILLSLFFIRKIDFKIKTWGILIFGYLLGTIGLISEGLISDGFLYYIIMIVLSSMLLGTYASVIIMVVSLLTSLTIAFLYLKNILTYDFDISKYAASFPVWLAFILVTALFTSMIIVISHKLNFYLFGIIKNLSLQTNNLNNAKKELELEIENKKIVENYLSQSEQKFKDVFDSIDDAIITFTNDYTIIDANKTFLTLSGLAKDQLEGKNIGEIIEGFEQLNISGNLNEFSLYRNEFKLRNLNDNKSIPVEITIIPFKKVNSFFNIAVISDIRERKSAEKQILNAIIQTEEKERTRISRDLHDSLGPLLSAVKLYSNSISQSSVEPKYQQLSQRITDMMNEAIKTVKEISNNLSSHLLKSFGLYEAVKSFAEKIQSTHTIKIDIEFMPEQHVSETIEITLYRVIVELINNTLKYASANRINIRLDIRHDKLLLTYKDNGVGFDFQNVIKEKKGMGLYNIHSRIKSLGGSVNFVSQPGTGTTVIIAI